MKHFATIELFLADDGFVLAEVSEPRGVGAYRSARFQTCEALLHHVAPVVALLKTNVSKLVRIRIGAGDVS